jgi:hypothetical protein
LINNQNRQISDLQTLKNSRKKKCDGTYVSKLLKVEQDLLEEEKLASDNPNPESGRDDMMSYLFIQGMSSSQNQISDMFSSAQPNAPMHQNEYLQKCVSMKMFAEPNQKFHFF